MRKTIRFQVALAAVVLMTGAMSFAQDGAAIYKAKCLNCHGAAGLADTGVGKALKMKAITDPSVKSMTEAQMVAATTNGTGKMQPFKGKITDAEIKAATDHFRTFIK
jgi:cytochrome c6